MRDNGHRGLRTEPGLGAAGRSCPPSPGRARNAHYEHALLTPPRTAPALPDLGVPGITPAPVSRSRGRARSEKQPGSSGTTRFTVVQRSSGKWTASSTPPAPPPAAPCVFFHPLFTAPSRLPPRPVRTADTMIAVRRWSALPVSPSWAGYRSGACERLSVSDL